MATILDMNIEQLRALLTAIMPDVQGLDQLPVKKLRIKLTEWLMMNRLSTLHKFESDEDGNWILPGECKSCRRYKIGYLDSSVIFISPSTAVLKQTPIVSDPVQSSPQSEENERNTCIDVLVSFILCECFRL